jgi:hypothetical protein
VPASGRARPTGCPLLPLLLLLLVVVVVVLLRPGCAGNGAARPSPRSQVAGDQKFARNLLRA